MRTQMILHATTMLVLLALALALLLTGHMIGEALLIGAVGLVFFVDWWLEYSDRWLWILRRNP
jgi:hypothetical protein